MKILFLSRQNSCRSQMAEAILCHLDQDKKLQIFSAGVEPADHVSPVAIEVLQEIGITFTPETPQNCSKFLKQRFDYLITVGDGTKENIDIPSIDFQHKLHLGFHNPYKLFKNRDELKQRCREIRDEIFAELEYFYTHILQKEMQPG